MKIFLRVTLILIIIGFIGTIAFTFILNSDFNNEENYEFHDLEFSKNDYIHININADNRDIEIKTHDSDYIKINFYTNDKDTYNVLTLNQIIDIDIKIPWYRNLFSLNFLNFTIDKKFFMVSILIPNDVTTYNYEIETSNGDITVDNINAVNMDLETDNGTVSILDSSFINNFKANTDNGKIKLENVHGRFADVDTSNGSITINDSSFNNIVLRTSNGDINASNNNIIEEFNAKTSNGRIVINNLEAGSISAKTSNGRIEALNLKSNDIYLYTSNGSITASIKGVFTNFKTEVKTANGDIHINGSKMANETYNKNASYKAYLRTANGSIDLSFIE